MTDPNPELYTKYPMKNIVIYNGTTILHYLTSALGIIIGYSFLSYGIWFGLIYLIIAFLQMYILMPLWVCPNCIYYNLKNGRCTSGLNIFSRKIAKKGNVKKFGNRAGGLSHNKLYMGSLIVPIIILIPALIINFSIILAILFICVILLLIYRMAVVFQKYACVHCRAKNICPNAQAMGLANK
jgi:hypothetical protein